MKTIQRLFFTILLLCLAACQTSKVFNYAAVQKEFNAAKPDYAKIVTQLKDSTILGLDPSLQPGAWLMRGMSEWELGRYEAANSSAIHGLDYMPWRESMAWQCVRVDGSPWPDSSAGRAGD